MKTFQPTHVNRNHELFLDSLKLAKLGGTIDLTCEDFPHGLIEDGKDPVIGFWRKPAGPVFPWSG